MAGCRCGRGERNRVARRQLTRDAIWGYGPQAGAINHDHVAWPGGIAGIDQCAGGIVQHRPVKHARRCRRDREIDGATVAGCRGDDDSVSTRRCFKRNLGVNLGRADVEQGNGDGAELHRRSGQGKRNAPTAIDARAGRS